MLDGTGMCGGCRVTWAARCASPAWTGPEFDAHQVDFASCCGAIASYVEYERAADERWRSGCAAQARRWPRRTRSTRGAGQAFPGSIRGSSEAAARRSNFLEVSLGLHRGAGARRRPPAASSAATPSARAAARWASTSVDSSRPAPRATIAGRGGAASASTNALPAICGRVCPQESQCEAACMMGRQVRARRHRRAGALRGRLGGGARPRPRAPGVAAARAARGGRGLRPGGPHLRRRAGRASATRSPCSRRSTPLGGVLRYGIPAFRLPQAPSLDLEVERAARRGRGDVHQRADRPHGDGGRADRRRRASTAVFLATGAGTPLFLGIPGENLSASTRPTSS